MESTPAERLDLVYQAYKDALARRPDDLKQAQTADQARQVMANVDSLESAYLDAVASALDANGDEVEACYQAAKDAVDSVEQAYEKGQALAAKITAVAGVVTAVSSLITRASA